MPGDERPERVGHEREHDEDARRARRADRGSSASGSTNCGQEREEEERRLRVQHVDDDALRECAAQVRLAAERDPVVRGSRERPDPEPDEVGGAGELDGGERVGRRRARARTARVAARDVDEPPDVDRRAPRRPPPAGPAGSLARRCRAPPARERQRARARRARRRRAARSRESPIQLPDDAAARRA